LDFKVAAGYIENVFLSALKHNAHSTRLQISQQRRMPVANTEFAGGAIGYQELH
jgi:hypothetical protein